MTERDEFMRQVFSLRNYMARAVVRTIGPTRDIDDIVQDTMIAAYNHWRPDRAIEDFKAFLVTIATRKAIDSKRCTYQKFVLFADLPPHQQPEETNEPDTSQIFTAAAERAEPSLILEDADARRLFEERLRQMSPMSRKCVLLRVDGLSQKEIAAHLGLSVRTIENNLRRGYRIVRDGRPTGWRPDGRTEQKRRHAMEEPRVDSDGAW